MTTVARRPVIPALTGVRFLAALSVALYHLSPDVAASLGISPFYFYENSGDPVELFFILSGFILTYTHPEVGGAEAPAIRQFYFSRFAKIYPIYLLGWIVFAPLVYTNLVSLHGHSAGLYARLAFYGVISLALLQAWTPTTATAWNTPGWSLSAEAVFYASFPFLFTFLKNRGVGVLSGLIGAFWLFSVIPTLTLSFLPSSLGNAYWLRELVNFTPVLRIGEFIAGICMARLYLSQGLAKTFRFDVAAFLALAAAVAVIVLANHLLAKALLFPAFILLLYFLARAKGPLSRWLGSKPMVLLGEASFAFYILHVPLFRYAKMLFPSVATSPVPFLGFLLALTAVSIFSFLSIEKPLCAYLRKAYKTSRSPRSIGQPEHAH
ncbi:acyltransferase [Caballeronia sp. SEWSISQ10-4 2]|uniref:acyltransferase family protein n=1 Tax=Caballeronia sp. SEWSISQ10-4 2 TaxID=2937438 RepID=UPI00264F5666|nr:acyltransferase [Caballeronia sp. SEWSISQ10-4 2]MDN7184531.1 acyltransferase [Caballeronia sp. SEWSISQ10-4 2]